jgi:hypothetical protein
MAWNCMRPLPTLDRFRDDRLPYEALNSNEQFFRIMTAQFAN